MKILLVLVVALLLAVAAALYFGSGSLSKAPSARERAAAADTAAAAAPKQSFTALTSLLQQDMTKIPIALDAPGVTPTNAFNIISRLGDSPARPEHQTLVKACNLIIYADKEHAVRQLQDQTAQQNRVGDSTAMADGNQAGVVAAHASIHARSQADWEAYRQQTEGEVKRLLDSLSNATL